MTFPGTCSHLEHAYCLRALSRKHKCNRSFWRGCRPCTVTALIMMHLRVLSHGCRLYLELSSLSGSACSPLCFLFLQHTRTPYFLCTTCCACYCKRPDTWLSIHSTITANGPGKLQILSGGLASLAHAHLLLGNSFSVLKSQAASLDLSACMRVPSFLKAGLATMTPSQAYRGTHACSPLAMP